jgi:hypothetical protein
VIDESHFARVRRDLGPDYERYARDAIAAAERNDSMSTTRRRKDEAGSPDHMVQVEAPDGSRQMIPAWCVAALEELAAIKGGSGQQGTGLPGGARTGVKPREETRSPWAPPSKGDSRNRKPASMATLSRASADGLRSQLGLDEATADASLAEYLRDQGYGR